MTTIPSQPLTPREKEVVHLREDLGLTTAKTAERMGVSKDTIWRHYSSARRKFGTAPGRPKAGVAVFPEGEPGDYPEQLVPAKLTPREEEIFHLRATTKLSFKECAKRMGLPGKQNASQLWKRARDKMQGRLTGAGFGRSDVPSSNAIEVYDPDRAAAFMDEALAPGGANIAALARKHGIPKSTATKIVRRFRTRYMPLTGGIEKQQTELLRDLCGTRARQLLEAFTPYDMATASARDKSVSIGILVEKTLLLDGKPTEIRASEDRLQLDVVVKMVAQEAVRRGIDIDVNPSTGETKAVLPERLRMGTGRQDLIPRGPE